MAEETANLPDRDQLLASIIAGATARTEAGELTWSHGTYGDTFRTKVNGLNVSVSRLSSQTSLTIATADHETITQTHETAAGPDRPLNALHGLARDSANRGTEQLHQLLAALENPRPEPQPPDRKKGLLARLGLSGRRN